MNDRRPLTTEQYPSMNRPFGTVVAAVVDANVLASDVARYAHDIDDHAPFLQQAASSRALRLFIPEGQSDEPLRAAMSVADHLGVEHDRVRSVWRCEYLPHIRVVADAGHTIDDQRLDALRRRDPADLPFGRLAARLAPVISLSDDHDLASNGLGVRVGGARSGLWAMTANQGWRSRDLTIVGARMAGHATASAVRSLRARPVVGLVAVGVAGGVWWWVSSRDVDWSAPRRSLSAVMGWLAEQWAAGSSAEREFENAVVTRQAPMTLGDAVARRLAVAPTPITLGLLQRLFPTEERPEAAALHHVLTSDPAFVRTGRGWQLGRNAAQ